MGLTNIHKLEKAVIMILNIDGWELEWTGEHFEHYDAKGKTPKGLDCVIEMKFRTKYYEEKMLENEIRKFGRTPKKVKVERGEYKNVYSSNGGDSISS